MIPDDIITYKITEARDCKKAVRGPRRLWRALSIARMTWHFGKVWAQERKWAMTWTLIAVTGTAVAVGSGVFLLAIIAMGSVAVFWIGGREICRLTRLDRELKRKQAVERSRKQ